MAILILHFKDLGENLLDFKHYSLISTGSQGDLKLRICLKYIAKSDSTE